MNIPTVISCLSRIFLFFVFPPLLPLVFAIFYKEYHLIWAYATVSIIFLALGLVLRILIKPYRFVSSWDAVALVIFGWICVCFISSFVYFFSGYISNFIHAAFETVSGFTTTGITINRDIESLPRSLLLWRSLTQWIGGFGIIVIVIAFLPFFEVGSLRLLKAEVSVYTEKVVPRMRETAMWLAIIYVFFTILETLLLWIKIPFFEALCTAFTTMPTGGFCVKNQSIAGFSSVYVETVVLIFMIIAGANFLLHYRLLFRADIGCYIKNSEFRLYIFFILAGTAYLLFCLLASGGKDFSDALRVSLFQVVSTITTTGFSSTNVMAFPVIAKVFILILMCAGGCVGSTAGSIKIRRHLYLSKKLACDIRQFFYPHLISKVRVDRRPVDESLLRITVAFVLMYIFTFFIFFMILISYGYDLETSFSASATCIGNVGIAFGKVCPNFLVIDDGIKLLLCLEMILGRLEIVCFIVFFIAGFWQRHRTKF